ncbi:unnamed protein product, partial [Tuber aestivum]
MQKSGRGGRGGSGGEPTEIISEAWIKQIKELRPAPKTASTKGWDIPPPRTYPIPFWVEKLNIDLPRWMFDTQGNLLDDLRFDDYGKGYTCDIYE